MTAGLSEMEPDMVQRFFAWSGTSIDRVVYGDKSFFHRSVNLFPTAIIPRLTEKKPTDYAFEFSKF